MLKASQSWTASRPEANNQAVRPLTAMAQPGLGEALNRLPLRPPATSRNIALNSREN